MELPTDGIAACAGLSVDDIVTEGHKPVNASVGVKFVLTQVVGVSYEEAADICQCPIGTIRSRVARARAELLETLRAAEAR